MKWFLNLKIAKKLIVAFIFVALIAGVVGVVGVVNIIDIDNQYTDMYERHTKTMPDLANVARAYQRQRVATRDLFLDDDNKMQKHIDEYETQKQMINEGLANFELAIKDPIVMENFNNLKNAMEQYYKRSDEIISLFQSGKKEEALDLQTNGGGQQISDAIQTATDNLFTLKINAASESSDANTASAYTATIIMIIVVIAGMFIAVVLGTVISRVISNPIIKLAQAADKLAMGDLNVEITANSTDEIGSLARSFDKMVTNTNDVLTNVASASEQVASGSRQISDSSIALSQGATEQASSVEELTASLEELSSQTQLNAQNANQANVLAEEVKSSAMQGNEEMKEMLKAMDEINESSSNISKIIKVIDDIAFQTNILALNAAVEAARAGQHGKGFAVVAEEVRNLAARSANAAKETTDMIEGSIRKVEGGTKIANETAEALGKIVTEVEKVANLIHDINIASNEQAIGIGQVNQALVQVSQVVQTNSATSEESAAASEELSSQAMILKQLVERFKLRNQAKLYNSLDEISPEVITMLENMAEKKKTSGGGIGKVGNEAALAKPTISLSDNEFGKY